MNRKLPSKEKQIQRRRRRVWELYYVKGWTQADIADELGVCTRTIIRDLQYLREHPEELPVPDDGPFASWNLNKLAELLDSGQLSPWQEAQIRMNLARSLVTKKVRREEEISVKWGSDEDSSDKE